MNEPLIPEVIDPQGSPTGKVKIVRVSVRNYKSLRAVEVTFDGNIHKICGPPGAGKTGLLESIWGGLYGIDPRLVTRGEDASEVILHLTDRIINRIQPADGSKETLSVSDLAGHIIQDPKPFLLALTGKGSALFRPLHWVTAGGGDALGLTERRRKQCDALLTALDMSLTPREIVQAVSDLGQPYVALLQEIDRPATDEALHPLLVLGLLEESVYKHRKTVNLDIKHAQNILDATPAPAEAPPETDAETLGATARSAREAYHRAEGVASHQEALRKRRDELKEQLAKEGKNSVTLAQVDQDIVNTKDKLKERKAKIAALQQELLAEKERAEFLEQTLADLASARRAVEDRNARRQTLERLTQELDASGAGIDVERLQADADRFERQLAARKAQDAHNRAAKTFVTLTDKGDKCTDLVKLFRDTLPQALLAKTPLPYPGLSFANKEILLNGIPLDLLGTAEQMTVGCAVSSAIHKIPGFVFLDGAESLGKHYLGIFARVAKERNLQVIMTVVDDEALPAPGTTVMQDGEVVAANGNQKTAVA